jgi:hypothetical protein
MEQTPRHQCLIYDGSPAKMLPAIAAIIKQRLSENQRCFYLNSPAMVAGLRSYLFAAGVDVAHEIEKKSLVLSSGQNHLRNGRFEVDQMLGMLEESLDQALADGYAGLWASGDMSWEMGRDKSVEKLAEYEWRLEKFFQTHPALSGICQYHAESLPREALCHSLLVHPGLFINETLARLNPRYTPTAAMIELGARSHELEDAVRNLCELQRGPKF